MVHLVFKLVCLYFLIVLLFKVNLAKFFVECILIFHKTI